MEVFRDELHQLYMASSFNDFGYFDVFETKIALENSIFSHNQRWGAN